MARAELLRRWLRAFGPATVTDIKWWFGNTLTWARHALRDIDAVEIDLDGTPGFALPDDDTGADLVAHPVPQMVSITGSTRAGMAVATSAAKDVKRTHLELGGKAPVIILNDADIEAAVEGLTAAGYFNAGQDCTAATRMMIRDGIYDEFLSTMTESVRNTKTEYDPADTDILFGPINNTNQMKHVSDLVSRAPEHARILAGGKPKEGSGFFSRRR